MQTAGLVNARLGSASLWRQEPQRSSPLMLLTVTVSGQRRQKEAGRSGRKRFQRGVHPRGQCNECSQYVYCNLGDPGPGPAWWGQLVMLCPRVNFRATTTQCARSQTNSQPSRASLPRVKDAN